MDVSDDSYYIQENNKNKGSQIGHTKKIFLKRQVDSNKNSWTEIKTNGLK